LEVLEMPRWLLWTLSVVAFAIVGRWALNCTFVLAGHRIDYPEWFEESRDYGESAIAILILIIIVFYEGRDKMGVVGGLAYNVRASAQGTFATLAIGLTAYMVIYKLLTILATTGVLPANETLLFGIPNDAPDVYHHILWSIHAGITEEIIVVGLTFFLLRRGSWEIGGKPFWLTGWATAITIAIRLSYHTYHGLMIIPMILTGWLFVRLYRATGSIIPLIVVHIMWDLFGLIAPNVWEQLASLIFLAILTEILTKGPSGLGQFGFPHFLGKDDKWPGFYWASWRWERGIEKPDYRSKTDTELKREGVNPVDA
jgi:hypothetical protein